MKLRSIQISFFTLLMMLLVCSAANASPALNIEGEVDLWCVIHEGNENGIQQASTQDPAADEVSGFNIKKGRLTFIYDDPEQQLGGKFQLRLEEKVDILDFYIKWKPEEAYEFYLGQMKVPSTYEAMSPDEDLDFISRSTLASLLTDWSLSRTSYYGTFYGNQSYFRDTGMAVKSYFRDKAGEEKGSLFFMIGNGLGHSLYIGGPESKEFIYSNDFGDFFYGLRLDCQPSDNLRIGGHYSLNKHDDVLFNDQTTVFDLDRKSHSIDVRYDSEKFRAAMMFGGGVIDDDYFHTGEKNLDYSGWETKVIVPLNPRTEAALRFDKYSFSAHGSPSTTNQNNWTLGVNYKLRDDMRIQLNYLIKDTQNGIDPDLDDNILYVNFQYVFDTGNLLDKGKPEAEKQEEQVVSSGSE